MLSPILGLARLTAVESRALGACVFSICATCAVRGGGLAADRADAARRIFRGHGWCGVAIGGGTNEKSQYMSGGVRAFDCADTNSVRLHGTGHPLKMVLMSLSRAAVHEVRSVISYSGWMRMITRH